MKFQASKWTTTLACAAVLVAPVTGFGDEDIDKTLEMRSDGTVLVENLTGSIEFSTWDRDEVQIRGKAGDDVEEIEITSSSNGVQVRVRNQKDDHRIDDTELYLRIPESANIEAEGVSVDITVVGNKGESIILNTVSGDLEVDAAPQRIELASVSGDVEFEGTVSRTTAETVSGDITLVGADGEVKASTVSGDVSLEAGDVSRGRFETVSGEINLTLALSDGGRLSCDSMSGDVELRLPDSQQAGFTAQSYSGNINTDFGKSVNISRGPGAMLEHSEGDNGATIRLETFSGDISISRR
jgi:DUF4097 and DUF4098 domain-containing protein YvlB